MSKRPVAKKTNLSLVRKVHSLEKKIAKLEKNTEVLRNVINNHGRDIKRMITAI